jgi:hypothetical protein
VHLSEQKSIAKILLVITKISKDFIQIRILLAMIRNIEGLKVLQFSIQNINKKFKKDQRVLI